MRVSLIVLGVLLCVVVVFEVSFTEAKRWRRLHERPHRRRWSNSRHGNRRHGWQSDEDWHGDTHGDGGMDHCRLRRDRGTCPDTLRRWYYNVRLSECRPFTFGGCGGNENNFVSRKSCEDYCAGGGNDQ